LYRDQIASSLPLDTVGVLATAWAGVYGLTPLATAHDGIVEDADWHPVVDLTRQALARFDCGA